MEISSVQALPESLEGIRKRMDKKMSFWFESRYPRYKYSQLGNIRLWFEARKMFLSGWGLIHKSSSASCFNVGLMMIEKLLQNHDFVENGGQVEEEARWLYNVFIDQSTGQLVVSFFFGYAHRMDLLIFFLKVPQNASEALTAFMKFIESHDSMSRKRSLCYAGIISHNRELIQQSANMGYELAHAWIQEHYSLEEVFMAASHVCSILEPFCIRCNLQTIRPGVAFANDEQYYFISKLAVEIGECVGYYWCVIKVFFDTFHLRFLTPKIQVWSLVPLNK